MGYYRKFGFEVKQEIKLARGEKELGLPIMVREPKVVKGEALNSKGGKVLEVRQF